MLKLDNALLEELGLGVLPDAQKRQMLQHIYDTLELRVGTHLANQMTDKQLEEFEKFIDAGGDANQAQALQWLETNLPNYKQVVQDTFEALKAEVKQMAPQLLSAAAQQPQEAQIVSQPTSPAPGIPQQQTYAQPPMPPQPGFAPSVPQPVADTPSPQQVMPSQQAPVDASQSWQQPAAYPQPSVTAISPDPTAAFGQPVQQPFAPSGPIPQPQPFSPDPFATPAMPQSSTAQFNQPQDFSTQAGAPTTPPAASPWQPPVSPSPNPTDSAWQPRPSTGQQPPQDAV